MPFIVGVGIGIWAPSRGDDAYTSGETLTLGASVLVDRQRFEP
jgi:hypothetical protein